MSATLTVGLLLHTRLHHVHPRVFLLSPFLVRLWHSWIHSNGTTAVTQWISLAILLFSIQPQSDTSHLNTKTRTAAANF